MMIEMRHERGRLVPVDDEGLQFINSLKAGQSVLVEAKRPRNIGHHRRLFALLNVVYPNTHYPNAYALLAALKVYLGHCDTQQTKNGKVVAVPRSIAFHAMGQDEFREFYDGCVQAIVEHFIPGLDPGDLRREGEEICGINGRAA